MNKAECKKILEEQLELLSKASKTCMVDELPMITNAMLNVIDRLLAIEP